MPRPAGSKNIVKINQATGEIQSYKSCEIKENIKLLDATLPKDSGMTNNQVRATERETRAKINEIINILNAR